MENKLPFLHLKLKFQTGGQLIKLSLRINFWDVWCSNESPRSRLNSAGIPDGGRWAIKPTTGNHNPELTFDQLSLLFSVSHSSFAQFQSNVIELIFNMNAVESGGKGIRNWGTGGQLRVEGKLLSLHDYNSRFTGKLQNVEKSRRKIH